MQAYVPGILGCISKSANMQILIMYTSKGADMKAVCVCVQGRVSRQAPPLHEKPTLQGSNACCMHRGDGVGRGACKRWQERGTWEREGNHRGEGERLRTWGRTYGLLHGQEGGEKGKKGTNGTFVTHKIRSMKKGHRKIAKKVRYTLELRKE